MVGTHRVVVSALAVVFAVAVFATPALAAASSGAPVEVKNTPAPGLNTRAVVETEQVYQHTFHVTHWGALHFDITYKPVWANVQVFLIGPSSNTGLPGVYQTDLYDVNEAEGTLSWWAGEQVIDWVVEPGQLANQATKPDPYSTASPAPQVLVGDSYTLVVDCLNQGVSSFKVTGYSPQYYTPDMLGGADQSWSAANDLQDPSWYERRFSHTGGRLQGPPYAGPNAHYVTSAGTVTQWVRWPIDPSKKTFTYNPTSPWLGYDPARPYLGEVDAYIFDAGLYLMAKQWPADWDPAHAVPAPTASPWLDAAYGDTATWSVPAPAPGDEFAGEINQPVYCYPEFWVANGDPTTMYDGSNPAKLAQGTSTVSVLQEVTYPADLQILSAPARAAAGASVTFSGTFGLNVGGTTDGWQDPGTPVYVQLFKGTNHVLRTWGPFNVGANGVWKGTFRPPATATVKHAKYRAFSPSPPHVAYDEYSNVKSLLVPQP
jgi:hypothetical protein